jgi:hypothetical protein
VYYSLLSCCFHISPCLALASTPAVSVEKTTSELENKIEAKLIKKVAEDGFSLFFFAIFRSHCLIFLMRNCVLYYFTTTGCNLKAEKTRKEIEQQKAAIEKMTKEFG